MSETDKGSTLETKVRSLGQEDLLEEETATHFSILAWEIQWTEKPGRLQSTGSQRVGHGCSCMQARQRQWRDGGSRGLEDGEKGFLGGRDSL